MGTKELTGYREYDIYIDDATNLDIDSVVAEFRDNGFEVEKEAILHNLEAWSMDYKSGYRGKHCHLFSPCGCNKLRFSASTLHELCDDWQTTYMA